MTSEQFCYWTQGFVEIMNGQAPNAIQWQIISDHLDKVLNKPAQGPITVPQSALNGFHHFDFANTGMASPINYLIC